MDRLWPELPRRFPHGLSFKDAGKGLEIAMEVVKGFATATRSKV